ncbi:MAG TPA: hypothetical protein VG963_17850 [Polyangiaceae bacterium]|nr:hypothetical protein [Polyangiaceae bacterium]
MLATLNACGGGGHGSADAGELDAKVDAKVDAGIDMDATGAPDAEMGDASEVMANDAGSTAPDGGVASCKPFVMPSGVDCSPPAGAPLPRNLRCTGLYGDFDQRTIACGLLEYKPAIELWSDGAVKRRFVSVPDGQKVDVSHPDNFVYPVGTRFWKEFRVKNAAGQLRMAETRLLQKSEDGWIYTSYVWSEDEAEAIQMDNAVGVPHLYDTGHTVPNRDQCGDCHKGRDDFVLGWDAIMLGPGAEGITRDRLVELGLAADASGLQLSIPGDDVERAALGYLHANCGVSCHNRSPIASAKDSGLFLKLEAAKLGSVFATDAVITAMNKPAAPNAKLDGLPLAPDAYLDIRPGDPEHSLLLARQLLRGYEAQMPRIATNVVDDAGVQITRRWIESMSVDGGYPPPGADAGYASQPP